MATVRKTRSSRNQTAEILSQDSDLLRNIIQAALQKLLETDMNEASTFPAARRSHFLSGLTRSIKLSSTSTSPRSSSWYGRAIAVRNR